MPACLTLETHANVQNKQTFHFWGVRTLPGVRHDFHHSSLHELTGRDRLFGKGQLVVPHATAGKTKAAWNARRKDASPALSRVLLPRAMCLPASPFLGLFVFILALHTPPHCSLPPFLVCCSDHADNGK